MIIPNLSTELNLSSGVANDDRRHQITPNLIKRFEHLHTLGSRPVAELIMQVADPVTVSAALSQYDRLDPGTVEAVGGDTFPTEVWEAGQ
jgi:hypothetical protein